MNARPTFAVWSGGQTGVDRAALDSAREAGLAIGGWCPRGRRAEDGPIAPRYPLRETASESYAERTERNVRETDATLVLSFGTPSNGTAHTIARAREMGKPLRIVDLSKDPDPVEVRQWLVSLPVLILNVAGPRGSAGPDIYARARAFLDEIFRPGL